MLSADNLKIIIDLIDENITECGASEDLEHLKGAVQNELELFDTANRAITALHEIKTAICSTK